MMARRVGGLRKHPHGRVDQLEDRYLGMVEAPSSNLGTSTPLSLIYIDGVGRAPKPIHCSSSRFLARTAHRCYTKLIVNESACFAYHVNSIER